MTDLSVPMRQGQFGELVGISQQAVSTLVQRGILPDGASADEWLLAYCDNLREVAAGRGGDAQSELTAERARLAREQADRIAMQNAERRGELAPANIIEQVLARVGARVGRLLETIPGELRRRMPDMTAEDVEAVTRTVNKARNLAAGMSLRSLFDEDEADTGSDTQDVADIEDGDA